MKIKNIEFLRFVFAWIIVYCHLNILTSVFPENKVFSFITSQSTFSRNAVDFFFILSGFFFALTLNTSLNVFDFLKKRFLRLWSVVAFATIGYLCLNILNITSYGKNLYDYVYSFVFLDNIGITLHHVGPSWYVSVLVLTTLLYFYLFKSLSKPVANLIIGFLVWFSYTYTINIDNGMIRQHLWTSNNIFCMGLLRGLGGVGIGIFLCYTYQYYKDSYRLNKFISTFLEALVFGWCVYSLFDYSPKITNCMIFIFAFVILIWLFITQQGLFTKLFENKTSVFLGKFAYSLFLTHLVIIYALKGTIWNNSNQFIINYPLICLALALITMYIFAIIVYYYIEQPNNKLFYKVGFIGYYSIIFVSLILVTISIKMVVKDQRLEIDNLYAFNRNYFYIDSYGLTTPETWGRWSNGDLVKLKFKYKTKQDIIADFDINPFLTDNKKIQKVKVFVNEKELANWIFEKDKDMPNTSLIIPQDISPKGKISIRFEIDNPQSPKELGVSEDSRKLGLGFKSLRLRYLEK